MLTVLKFERLKRGKQLREVAREIGMPEVSLCRVENGQGYVPPAYRERLAEFYGLAPDELWNEYGWPLIVADEQPAMVRKTEPKQR